MQNITIYNKEESITFNGKYSNQNRILATISITPFEFMNFKWNSVEHLYRYLKYYNNLEAKKFIIRTPNPLHVKEISNYLQYELKTYNQIPEFDKNRHINCFVEAPSFTVGRKQNLITLQMYKIFIKKNKN